MVFLFFTFFLFVIDLVASVSNVTYTNTLYIITNAETPSLNLPGLTPVGKQRAEVCLPEVSFCVVQSLDDEVLMPLSHQLFRPLNIGFIATCPLNKKNGLCAETITTAQPIASSLGLGINTSW